MLTEIIGYIGMILVVISLLISDAKKFRFLNLVGAFLSMVFSLLKGGILPLFIMNFAIVAIDIYYLLKIIIFQKNNK